MGRRVSISIGVQNSGGLVALPGAVQGARDFAAWSRDSGYDVHEFIDADTGPVRVADVFEAVQTEVDRGDVENMLIFFAGHGVATGAAVDFWLLSGAPDNPNEAVNVQHSLRLARRCGIPHVVFFSDACRTQAGKQHIGIYGSSIFPQKDVRSPVDLDQFFAARSGDRAYETTPDEDLQKAFGLFSECVIQALRGKAPDALELVADGQTPQAVTARSLRQYLDVAVPIEASRRGVEQFPDCWPGSYWPPNVITWVRPVEPAGDVDAEEEPHADEGPEPSAAPPPAAAQPAAAPPPPPTSGRPRQRIRQQLARRRRAARQPASQPVTDTAPEPASRQPEPAPAPAGPNVTAAAVAATGHRLSEDWLVHMPLDSPYYEAPREIDEAYGQFTSGTGRDHFETASGLTIIGADASRVALHGGYVEVFEEEGHLHARGNGPPSGAVVDLGGDRYAVAAFLPDFVGTVHVGRSGVDLVLYEPATTGRFQPDPAMRKVAARLAAHLRYGLQDTALDPLVMTALFDGEYVPPTIAVLAAYALDRAGRRDELERLVGAFVDCDQPIPFDVAQVADLVDDVPDSVVPQWPLMTQGWAYLTPHEVHPAVWGAHEALTGAAWTTVSGAAGRRLFEALQEGELP